MLEMIDLDQSLSKEDYIRALIPLQVAMHALGYQVYVQQRPVVIVYEGWDAAGKGGNIKRVTEKLDPRGYMVHPISAPQGDDKTHHYLWRFWRRLPEKGQIAIFDRSWYGRVMVERIEGFCSEEEWKRAYREINHFERQLVDFGTILFKFWIHISREEQLSRFEDRKDTAYKAWKLTDEDWRNREKWELYAKAVNEMLRKTSTITAPWTVVPGNCKWVARLKVLETIVDGLCHELNFDPFTDMPELKPKKKKKSSVVKQEELAAEEALEPPMIDRFEYGVIEIDGKQYEKDIVILPNGKVKPWQPKEEHLWRVKDFKEVLGANPDTIILGLGSVAKVELHPKLEKKLQKVDLQIHHYKTEKACEVYKSLRGQARVAVVLHLFD